MEGKDNDNSDLASSVSAPKKQEPSSSGACPKIPRRQTDAKSSALKRLSMTEDVTFMKNFDPDKSNREKKKIEQALKQEKEPAVRVYDPNGRLSSNGKDLCDCLDESCPGCHFPCPKCTSCKCGHVCRNNRNWAYEEYEIEGSGIVIKNKNL